MTCTDQRAPSHLVSVAIRSLKYGLCCRWLQALQPSSHLDQNKRTRFQGVYMGLLTALAWPPSRAVCASTMCAHTLL